MRIAGSCTWSLVVPLKPVTLLLILYRNGGTTCQLTSNRQLDASRSKSIMVLKLVGFVLSFKERMVEFTDHIGKPIHLLYYPPYHSKYNPIERCWGILEQHWNGAKLTDALTMLLWARSMTWKAMQPVVKLNLKTYEKGISLTKKAMRAVERRLERNPLLPKWDILIRPA
ncbi:hypothetical protein C7B79_36405 [Chroococcidiopsis cubana CCALA 043]|nr:hypothetical protein C7B79_36405 [Chroococcidiopsis cubana CCALA 043]